MRPLRTLRLSLLVLVLAGVIAATSAAAAGPPREPFFPGAGDPGIDVLRYGVSIFYKGRADGIKAGETIVARSTRQLRQVSLDLDGLRVRKVRVNGVRAAFARKGDKLTIELPRPAAAGEELRLNVRYGGRPRVVTDPDGTSEGWIPTDDGAVALGEPQGTATWLACNNVPWDKARFDVTLDVPWHLGAVSNGKLVGFGPERERNRFHWQQSEPMSPYLALIDIGRGRVVKTTIAGHPSWTLIDPRLAGEARPVLAELPKIIRFESRLYGGYPFAAAGSAVDFAPKIGYALETQTRPFYPYLPDVTTVVHETAHQWFGDSVGLKRWPNIWLNEGFATWTEWYYAERHGGRSAQAIFNRLRRVPASNEEFWNPPSGHPGSPKHMFGPSVYVRGAMALEALRLRIGTKAMLRLLRTWAVTHRYGSAEIVEFTALAERISGQDLGPFFQRWLYRRGKP
jgi:aminopeptidase N